MRQNDFTDLSKLSMYRYETFFNIYTDNNDFKFYNLLRNINLFPANNSEVEVSYNTKYNDTWHLISYKYYNTMDLWWLICAYNQIQNPVKMPEVGTELKILKANYVSTIISELNKQISR
jgi:nucleoid-associated protein YgaU